MTATAPTTAAQMTQMADTPDPRPDPSAAATAAAEPAGARRWAILGDNPLLTLVGTGAAAVLTVLGAVAVALLLFILDDHSNRLDRLEDTVADGFAAQDAKIDELDRKLTALMAELDRKLTAQIAELDRRLTALIRGLNMADEVDAALEGRLRDSESAAAGPDGEPG